MPSLTVNPPAAKVKSPAVTQTADHRQADYFLRLLAEQRSHIDHRIGEYRRASADAESAGDAEGAGDFRRMAHIEELDRRTLDGLIDNLHRRFPVRTRVVVR